MAASGGWAIEHRAGFTQAASGVGRGSAPILERQNGVFLGRVVIELWQLNPGVPGDGAVVEVGPVSSNAEAVNLLTTAAQKLYERLHHPAP